MKEKEIQESLMQYFYPMGTKIMAPNISTFGMGECDLLTISESDMLHEIEIKISRSDFKADFKKPKHGKMKEVFSSGVGHHVFGSGSVGYMCANRFSFACPSGLIYSHNLPADYYGLYWIEPNGEVKMIKKAKILHKFPASKEVIRRVAQSLTAKMTYGCAYMTYKNRKFTDSQSES